MKRYYMPILLLLFFISCGCATGYHKMGLTGGYKESQVDINTYSVLYRGNAHTSHTEVLKYLMYRCAELTVDNGYNYFIVTGGDIENKITNISKPGSYHSSTSISLQNMGISTYGSASTRGSYTPPETKQYIKYTASAIIKLYKGEKPDDNGVYFNAYEVIKILEPYIR